MTTLYNDTDPKAAAWLRELVSGGHITKGPVNERSIAELGADDLRDFHRVHLFAGIGGWDYALRLAGWPDDRPVWTGSCPCQPFSSAGKGKGNKDERHLWPEMFRLIRECRPDTVFGEQVASAIGHGWLDGVFADLEGEGYACGAVVLGAHSVGAPHIRQRLYWVADSDGRRFEGSQANNQQERGSGADRLQGEPNAGGCGESGWLADSLRPGLEGCQLVGERTDPQRQAAERGGDAGGLGLSPGGGNGTLPERGIDRPGSGEGRERGSGGSGASFWSAYDLIPCRDGKSRRVESGIEPLAHGVPARVGRLRGYGNAIVPQVAAEFVRAFLDKESDQ